MKELEALDVFIPTFTAPDGDVVDNDLYEAYNKLKQALNKLHKIEEIVNTGASAIEKYLHIESLMKRSD